MPWERTEPMNERVKFIARFLEEDCTFSELCEDFGISRKTGYKWVERYEEGGSKALLDRPRAPLSHPHAISDEAVRKIIAIREKHPHWGPKKLLVVLKREDSNRPWPAASTIGEILKRHGLVRKRKRIRRSSPYQDRLEGYNGPNAVWCADFKGNFPVGGKRCHPLTISDGFSRFLIRCKALPRPLSDPCKKVFEAAFREYGLPNVIRTDNGAPFSTLAPGGLSRLAIWWIKLGITPERIMPGRPEQNGRHERMHSTLKAETAKPPRSNFRSQQQAFDKFIYEFNFIRPHEALDFDVPASIYKPSARAFPSRLPEVDYPEHFEVRRAYPNGVISFRETQWYISKCLNGEPIGLEEVGNGCWRVFFSHILLGIIDLKRHEGRRYRHFGTLIRMDGEINGCLWHSNRNPK